MLPGFPKNVIKEKVRRGHYRLKRDDGFTVEVKHGVGGWWFGNTGRKVKSLSIAEYDMRNGYTSRDQVGVDPADRPESVRQAMWETAMGMRGYTGSPAQAEDVRERRRREKLS